MSRAADRDLLADLFDHLCDLTPDERAEYLAERDLPEAVVTELNSLLICDHENEEFLESPVSTWGCSLLGANTPSPDHVPGCEIVRLLGEGGMGRVWEARQLKPIQRPVAVKVVKSHFLFDRDALFRRFRIERQTLAQMNHPNIAQIYGGGQTDNGEPYLLMEFVEQGTPLLAYCREQRLSLAERLDLFMQVCRGVKHAHQKGIIHRDLKPANILVKILDKKPVVKIIDFGIAAQSLHISEGGEQPKTKGVLAGTPLYMAPEQADLEQLDIDTQTDVYALSVILYQLVADHTPFANSPPKSASLAEVRKYIAEKRPLALRDLAKTFSDEEWSRCARDLNMRKTNVSRLFHGDLSAVLLKGLATQRHERYESVAALVDDLRAFCEHRPVAARSASTLYVAQRFVRRNRNLLGIAALIFVSLCSALITTSISLVRLTLTQEKVLSESRKNKQINDFLGDIFKSAVPEEDGNVDVLAMLQRVGRHWSHPLYVPDQNPEVRASMHLALGRAYRALNHFNLAEAQFQQAVQLLGETLGNQSPEYLQALFEHAVLLSATEQNHEALNLFRKITAWNKLTLGDNHHQTLVAQIHLAGCYLKRDDLAKAERLFQRSLAQAEQHLGQHQPIVGQCKRSLALTLIKRQQYDTAERMLLALHDQEKLRLPESHPDLMLNLHLLSLAVSRGIDTTIDAKLDRSFTNPYWYAMPSSRDQEMTHWIETGDRALSRHEFNKAEKFYSHAYQMGIDVFGREHLQTQKAAAALSRALAFQGKHSETEAIARDHEKIARMQFGHSHPITLTLRDNLSRALVAQGKQREADLMLQDNLFADGPSNETKFAELRESNEIAKLYLEQNRFEQAEHLAQRNLARCRRLVPQPNHPKMLPFLETLAEIHFRRGDNEAGNQILGEAVVVAGKQPLLYRSLEATFHNKLKHWRTEGRRTEQTTTASGIAEPQPAAGLPLGDETGEFPHVTDGAEAVTHAP